MRGHIYSSGQWEVRGDISHFGVEPSDDPVPSRDYWLQVASYYRATRERLRLQAGQHENQKARLDGQDHLRGRTEGMRVVDLSLKQAEEFLAKHERHYKAPIEPICAIGVGEERMEGGVPVPEMVDLHGAAILGRRRDGLGELAHIYCDGASQAYSLLYGACWRALKALGYEKAVL